MTDIVLITEVKNPLQPMEFRPTSLCNAIYKIVVKICSSRVRKVFPSLISEN